MNYFLPKENEDVFIQHAIYCYFLLDEGVIKAALSKYKVENGYQFNLNNLMEDLKAVQILRDKKIKLTWANEQFMYSFTK